MIAEAGADLSAFPSEKQFASWLGLCPTNEQSGGKILNRRTRKVVNRATVAFRNAALTLLRSQSYLGTQYRRLRTRLALPKPSLPWLESWPACSTGSSNTASRTWTKAPNIMKPSIASNRSDHSPNGHKNLAFNWSFRKLLESALQGFWKDSWPIAFFGCPRGHRVNKETRGAKAPLMPTRGLDTLPRTRALRESTGQRQA